MSRQRTRLVLSDRQLQELTEAERVQKSTKLLKRLQVIRLCTSGVYTRSELAETVGVSRSRASDWLNMYRDGGLDKLLELNKPGASPSPMQAADVQEFIREQLDAGNIRTAPQLAQKVEENFGIQRKASAMYRWLKKLRAGLRVPRLVNRKKNPQAADDFIANLEEHLVGLELDRSRPVRIWVQDESRFGLHTIVRRVWARRGVRVVLPTQQKYKWGYLYGALEIGTGASEFAYWSRVDLEISTHFLSQLVASEPDAQHVVIWDGAGFHPKPHCHEIPENIHLIQLPAYSPELNPIEKLWDVLKDELCNRNYDSLDELWEALSAELSKHWNSTAVQRLLGTGTVVSPANAT
jgi:transposase